jgi:hypothetical protein
MGKIRGTHNSPGIYTRTVTSAGKGNPKDNRKAYLGNNGETAGGGGKGSRPWVFSDYFVIVFS